MRLICTIDVPLPWYIIPLGYMAAVINDRLAELYSDRRNRPNKASRFVNVSILEFRPICEYIKNLGEGNLGT